MVKHINVPSVLLLIGGIATLIGAFWSGIQTSKQEDIINQKNDEIKQLTIENKELTSKTINIITGGNSYAFHDIGIRHKDGIASRVGLKLQMVGNFPLSDVTIKITRVIEKNDLPTRSFDIEVLFNTHYPLITHDLFAEQSNFFIVNLDEETNRFLRISIVSRNGEIEQQIKFSKKTNGYYCMATKVIKYNFVDGSFRLEPLFERVDDEFPKPVHWM